jgi:myo-inositol 2-dehydrogenase / D-chiro-inositol 1-dehydrogenase
MEEDMMETKPDDRRRFLGTAGSGLLLLSARTAFGSEANSAVEVGIVGCGSRGFFVGGFFQEFAGARIVAVNDAFHNRVDAAREHFRTPGARAYVGVHAFRDMVQSKLDAVVIESPPYFHPEQAAAAVAAGKHVYLAKPVAVDVPGCLSILQSGKRAEGKTSFFVDFQLRAKPVFQECVERVRRGDIGRPVLLQSYYHGGRLQPKNLPGDSPAQARLRNWVFDKALSGDVIVEQHIHALDGACWLLDAHPVKASGTGGRLVRTDVGDAWDHFVVTFWYPNGVKVDFSSTQCIKGYGVICNRLYGDEGTAEMNYGGSVDIWGSKAWKGSEKEDTGRQGAIDNVKTFVANLRAGKLMNNAAESVRSNLTCILGRTAAYREGSATWDEMMRASERLDGKLEGLA